MKLGNRLYFLSILIFLNISTLVYSCEQRITLPKNLIRRNGKFIDAITNSTVILNHENVAIIWDFDETLASHDEKEYKLFCENYKKELAIIIKAIYNVVPPLNDDERFLFKAVKTALSLPVISDQIMFYRGQGLTNFAQCMIDMYCVRNPRPGIYEILTLLTNRGYSHFLATNQGPLLFNAIHNKQAFKKIFSNVASGLTSSVNDRAPRDTLFNTSTFKKPMQNYFNDFQRLLDPSRKYKYYILIDDTVRNFKMFPEMDDFIGIRFENSQILLQDLQEMNLIDQPM